MPEEITGTDAVPFGDFTRLLDLFQQANPCRPGTVRSRAEQTLPRLRLDKQGKYTVVQGLLALARHTRRPEDYVLDCFVTITGAVIHATGGNRTTIRGQLPLRLVKRFQNYYLEKKVCCRRCRSPETDHTPQGVRCKNCGDTGPH